MSRSERSEQVQAPHRRGCAAPARYSSNGRGPRGGVLPFPRASEASVKGSSPSRERAKRVVKGSSQMLVDEPERAKRASPSTAQARLCRAGSLLQQWEGPAGRGPPLPASERSERQGVLPFPRASEASRQGVIPNARR